MTSAYENILRTRVSAAVEMARAVNKIPHAETRGKIREILFSELLRPLLPPNIGIGTGQVIDRLGNMSTQMDFILFDRSIAPPLMIDSTLGLYPLDCSLYVIEIKTKLNKKELWRSHKNALQLQKLVYSEHHCKPFPWTRYLLFAFDSDLAKMTDRNKHILRECRRYQKLYSADPDIRRYPTTGRGDPPIRSICVVGREYGHEDGSKWTGVTTDDDFSEVVIFMGNILNTYKSIVEKRRPIWMEDYLSYVNFIDLHE
jgi:hypothetical protein